MKHHAKRQVVVCPICHKPRVTLGGSFFRCCGENHPIKKHLLTADQLTAGQKAAELLEISA